jgi:hypothetical protein
VSEQERLLSTIRSKETVIQVSVFSKQVNRFFQYFQEWEIKHQNTTTTISQLTSEGEKKDNLILEGEKLLEALKLEARNLRNENQVQFGDC